MLLLVCQVDEADDGVGRRELVDSPLRLHVRAQGAHQRGLPRPRHGEDGQGEPRRLRPGGVRRGLPEPHRDRRDEEPHRVAREGQGRNRLRALLVRQEVHHQALLGRLLRAQEEEVQEEEGQRRQGQEDAYHHAHLPHERGTAHRRRRTARHLSATGRSANYFKYLLQAKIIICSY